MKLLVASLLVALAAARPQTYEEQPSVQYEPQSQAGSQYRTLEEAGILRMDSSIEEDGSFVYGFETTDPIQQDVAGQLKQIGEEYGTVMQGSYSFVTPEGQEVTITWTADENGFQATGDAIPVDANSARAAETSYVDSAGEYVE